MRTAVCPLPTAYCLLPRQVSQKLRSLRIHLRCLQFAFDVEKKMPAGFVGVFESDIGDLFSILEELQASIIAAFVQFGFRRTDKLRYPADGISIGRGNGFDDVLGIGCEEIDDQAVGARQFLRDFRIAGAGGNKKDEKKR